MASYKLDAESFPKKLRKLRGKKSVRTIAKECGISASAWFMYEEGQRIPRDEIKVRLCNFFGVSPVTLFFPKDNHES